jgi:hypothetical protein
MESIKPQYTKCVLRKYYHMEWRQGCALRERKAKYKQFR